MIILSEFCVYCQECDKTHSNPASSIIAGTLQCYCEIYLFLLERHFEQNNE